jgi:hypothetical protein
MAQPQVHTQDSVRKIVRNGGLGKTLNTLRTVPGAPNPFVTSRAPANSNGSSDTSTPAGARTDRK